MKNLNENSALTVALGPRSYSIHIGTGLLEKANDLLPFSLEGRSAFLLYDENVEGQARRLAARLSSSALRFESLSLRGGEGAKSFATLQMILDWMLTRKVDRQSVLFVMGGGVLGDLGGFAASIVLRGISFVQIPTTLLAQVDSSVGGKTGINTVYGKNLVGSFYQPSAVLCDLDTLKTLPAREIRSGYAEIVKYGLIDDLAFYEWLEDHGAAVLGLEPSALAYAIRRSCATKAAIVGDDEREEHGGRRVLLNLGHTFGHALEAACGYDGGLLHGEAVGIGLVLALRLSVAQGLCQEQDFLRVKRHLDTCGLMTEIAHIPPPVPSDSETLFTLMTGDKKSNGGKIGFVLLRGIGNSFQNFDVVSASVKAVLESSIRS